MEIGTHIWRRSHPHTNSLHSKQLADGSFTSIPSIIMFNIFCRLLNSWDSNTKRVTDLFSTTVSKKYKNAVSFILNAFECFTASVIFSVTCLLYSVVPNVLLVILHDKIRYFEYVKSYQDLSLSFFHYRIIGTMLDRDSTLLPTFINTY